MVTTRSAPTDPPPPQRQRARADEDKAARRQQLLTAALQLFERREYSDLTVSAIAAQAGLAKGTVYLYFRSKEALFLQLVLDQLGPWFEALAPYLAVVEGPDALGRLLARELTKRPMLMKLLSILHTVLEQNLDIDRVVAFKRTLLRWMRAAAVRIETRFPQLNAQEALRMMNRFYALTIGLYQTSTASQTMRAAIAADPKLAILQIDFEEELAASVAAMVRGEIARKESIDV